MYCARLPDRTGWKETEVRHGNGTLASGYQNASKLDTVLFTPSTKAELGEHDRPVTAAELEQALGADKARLLAERSVECYSKAADHAAARGVIIADTKFEFGEDEQGRSCGGRGADARFQPSGPRELCPGEQSASLDKQFLRDWLDSVAFSHQPPAPNCRRCVSKTPPK